MFNSDKVAVGFPVDVRPREQTSKFENGSPVNNTGLGTAVLVLDYKDPIDCVKKTMDRYVITNKSHAPLTWPVKKNIIETGYLTVFILETGYVTLICTQSHPINFVTSSLFVSSVNVLISHMAWLCLPR